MANTPRTSTSRKPRSAARAASRPPADHTAPEPEAAGTAAEIEAEHGYVTALLCGEELQIIPPGSWRASWQAMLTQGQLPDFVEHVVHPDDLDLFWEIDPTSQEFYALIEDAARAAGESLGKSRGPAPSSRSTRRR